MASGIGVGRTPASKLRVCFRRQVTFNLLCNMETQQEPCFRPRVLPMPKVGDEICFALYDGKTTYTGRVTSIVGGRKFKADSPLGELTGSVGFMVPKIRQYLAPVYAHINTPKP